MLFRIDAATRHRVEGWVSPAENVSPVALQVLLDGTQRGDVTADVARPDVSLPDRPDSAVWGFRIDETIAPGYAQASEVEIRAGALTLYRARRDAQLSAQRLFLMHVPKTGGTSLNHALNPLFESAYNHLESRPVDTARSILGLSEPRSLFLSGHLLFHDVAPALLQVPTRLATLLRRPLDQLISHMAWVYHVTREPAHAGHDPYIFQAGHRIAAIDVDDERSVAAWVEGFAGMEPLLFNNIHTRYLGCRNTIEPASPDALQRARSTIRDFDIVGRIERVDLFARRLDRLVGADLGPIPHMRVNPDVERFRPLLRFEAVLRPLVALDEVLYQDVVETETLTNRLAAGWRAVTQR